MSISPAEAMKDSVPSSSSQSTPGALRWIWRGLVGILMGRRNVDFEKRLQHLSAEEVSVHTRLKRRTHTWRKVARAIVMYSLILESLALGLALFSARTPDMPWKERAIRVLPVFVVPAVASLAYTICSRYYHMRERKDQRTLEKLRAERQARIDELKQKTNYYATQELIQRYDLDPTAKAAAASVLAAKLGADSGMNVAFKISEVTESSNKAANSGKSRSPAAASESGLRNRKSPQQGQNSEAFEHQSFLKALEDEVNGEKEREALERDAAMDRARGRAGVGAGGGLMARIAAMLVGEDPSQCYALICKTCHMHNGLAPKEEFQYVTYVCPHCHTLNGGQITPRSGERSVPQLEGPSATNDSLRLAAAVAEESITSMFTAHTAESEIAGQLKKLEERSETEEEEEEEAMKK